MGEYAKKAVCLFSEGCNCAQAVMTAFSDVTGLSAEQSLKLSAAFGGGMGRSGEVCGALSAALMVFGTKCAPDDPKNAKLKMEFYEKVRTLMAEFAAPRTSYLCREIPASGKDRCMLCVRDAALLVEKYLLPQG